MPMVIITVGFFIGVVEEETCVESRASAIGIGDGDKRRQVIRRRGRRR